MEFDNNYFDKMEQAPTQPNVNWASILNLTQPTGYRKWISKDAQSEGIIAYCNSGKVTIWSVLFIHKPKDAKFVPCKATMDMGLAKEVTGIEYQNLLYIFNRL